MTLVLVLVLTRAAARSERVLGCATPKAMVDAKTHRLDRRWIAVYETPSPRGPRLGFTIAAPLSLWVIAESGGFSRVRTSDTSGGWPFKPHTVLGWVRTSDIEDQAIRNCT